MKKILSLALVFVMMFAFVSCGKSVEDIEKNLEKADYDVTVLDGDLATAAAEAFLRGIDVEIEGDVVAVLRASKDDEYVQAIEFEKASDAKAVKKAYDDAVEELKEELGDDYDEEDVGVYDRAGNTVILASSKDAMKDAK